MSARDGEVRVALLARDLVWEDRSGGSLAFSYAARKLEASLRSAPDSADVATALIDLRSDDDEVFFERLREFRPTVVAASTYIWSLGVFCRLAERVRRWDPSVWFVMGGPAARPSALRLAPYAPYVGYLDAVVTGEGEQVIRDVVRAARDGHRLGRDALRSVPGLHLYSPLGWRRTSEARRPTLDDYASPYHLPGVPRGGIGYIETYRGCPISCAFCQWGIERSDRVYSTEYLVRHLEGLEASGAHSVFVLDPAFNLSPRAFRNLVAAERHARVLERMQVLGHIYPTHLQDEHLAFFETFGRAEISVGVQSLDPDVLARLGRPFDVPRFERVLGALRNRFDVDAEIILGLPGDDPASFRRTLDRTIELASSVRVFYCLALPDALLERAEEQSIDFDPVTFMVRSCRGWSERELRETWEHVHRVAAQFHRLNAGPNWLDFRTRTDDVEHGDGSGGRRGATRGRALTALRDAIAPIVARVSPGSTLAAVRCDDDALILDLDLGATRVVLSAEREQQGARRFIGRDGIAYSYRGTLSREQSTTLAKVVAAVHERVRSTLAARASDAA
jgi:radical SAM superfamily enzyme YgiQ (UPF0313 family)